MAERQQVFRWVRDLLAAGLVALTVTTLTVTTIQDVDTISGQNTGGSGDCEIDMCAAAADTVTILGDTLNLSCGAQGLSCDASDTCLNFAGQSVCADGSGISAASNDDNAQITLEAVGSLTATGGNDVTITATNGSDVTITASGDAEIWGETSATIGLAVGGTAVLDPAAGCINFAGQSVCTRASLLDLTAATVGADIVLSAADDIDIDADAANGHVELTGGGASLLLNNAGAVLATAGADTLTLNTGGLQATIEQGGLAYRMPGQVLAWVSNVALSGTSEEVVASFTIPAGALTTNGQGVLIEADWTVVPNANTKQARVRVGGAGAGLTGAVQFSCNLGNTTFAATRVWVVRSGASAQLGGGTCIGQTTSVASGSAALSTAAAIEVVLTMAAPTASTDAALRQASFRWF